MKCPAENQFGFTFIAVLTVVMIMGVMLGMVGQSWQTIMQREREKELIFRGSQIKEAIENWYDPAYTVQGVKRTHKPIPLSDLKYLLDDPTTLSRLRYLPHSYAADLESDNPRCAPDCAKLKVLQDPLTGKEWTLIRGSYDKATGKVTETADGTLGGGIIGVASTSNLKPFKTDFKDTALETMGNSTTVTPANAAVGALPIAAPATLPEGSVKLAPGLGGKMDTYRQWRFIADPKNDHSKLYRAYHEGW